VEKAEKEAISQIKAAIKDGADDICAIIIETIHVDAGNKGPTSRYISEIVGWVRACGFDCRIKPDSYCASSIADRVSK
jgi:predicted RNase H-related nuclease YkuK (DUF458 family)